MKRRVLAKAARDLAQVEAYIQADNPQAARAAAARIKKAFDLITARPEIGRPTRWPNVREWSIPGLPYLIPYRIKDNEIQILRVWHTSRNRPSEW
jgi:plasmid stabilization system protein ParE